MLAWRCRDCGIVRAQKWFGNCPGCNRPFDCKQTTIDGDRDDGDVVPEGEIVSINAVRAQNLERIASGIGGLDRILGTDRKTGISGIAANAGHAIQIYAPPGSGKSTLWLQALRGYTKQRHRVLYIAGEERPEQIKDRADRIGKFNQFLKISSEKDLDGIVRAVEEVKPRILFVDSIQSVSVDDYDSGSLAAIVIAARELVEIAKNSGMGVVLVVQIDKSGTDFAGPKALEHLVDTALFLRSSGSKNRVLECVQKNRFGSTPERSYFTMTDAGLVEQEPPEEKKTESGIIVTS